MRVIDARSGVDVKLYRPVRYPDGEWWRMIDFQPGLFEARALVEGNRLQPSPTWVKLPVRYTHPGFFFQRVAFMPT
jgi:hypothetical protein